MRAMPDELHQSPRFNLCARPIKNRPTRKGQAGAGSKSLPSEQGKGETYAFYPALIHPVSIAGVSCRIGR